MCWQRHGKHRMCCRLISPVSLLTSLIPLSRALQTFASLSMNAPGCEVAVHRFVSWNNESGERAAGSPCIYKYVTLFQPRCPTAPHIPEHSADSQPCSALLRSDGGMVQSQDDSIVGTKQCRHSVAIMPIPGNLSSSSPDLLQPATSVLDFSNPAGKKSQWREYGLWEPWVDRPLCRFG